MPPQRFGRIKLGGGPALAKGSVCSAPLNRALEEAAGHKADIEPVRQRLLEYFTIPEPSDERLKRARRRLATLMY